LAELVPDPLESAIELVGAADHGLALRRQPAMISDTDGCGGSHPS
jgi:hypothetical protein